MSSVAVAGGTVGYKHNYTIPTYTRLSRFIQTHGANVFSQAFVQRVLATGSKGQSSHGSSSWSLLACRNCLKACLTLVELSCWLHFQASCQATEVMIAHLQPQMGNVERLHCEARDSWRMASPQASSNARGPDVRRCVSKAADCSGLVSSLCGVLALKGALSLSLLLQELVQKAALLLHGRERRKC